MKRPFGFDSALREAKGEIHIANMTISKNLIIELEDFINTLESQLQHRKTVKDAVDYFDGVWPDVISGSPPPYDEQVLLYCIEGSECGSSVAGNYYAGGKGFEPSLLYQVCTREEFEAEAERRKCGEWTHKNGNRSCKIISTYKGWSMIEEESTGAIICVIHSSLKERKSTISKADAWDKLMAEHENTNGKSIYNTFCEILEQFEAKR